MTRLSLAARIILPAVWIGLIIGISFIEAPLKFQAPGITIPLGLGIGRLVFTAMNIVAGVLLILLTIASLKPRLTRGPFAVLFALWGVLLIEVALIRPQLNRRTDQVLAGVDEGGSIWHYLYIAADGSLLVLLIIFLTLVVRQIIPAVPATTTSIDQRSEAAR